MIANGIVRAGALVAALTLVGGCKKRDEPAPATPSAALLGKWMSEDTDETIEFFQDGTVIVAENRQVVGNYSVLDESRVRIDLRSETDVRTFKISGNQLTLTTSRGRSQLYRKPGGTPEDLAAMDRKRKITRCTNNLRQLWRMENNYMIQFGGPQKRMPVETGGDFWLKLSRTTPPLIDESLSDIYCCPFQTKRAGATDYRGPKSDVNVYPDGYPVGACIGNHPDGSAVIIRKSCDTQIVKESDAIYKMALDKTSK